jgi:hypothetical protein
VVSPTVFEKILMNRRRQARCACVVSGGIIVLIFESFELQKLERKLRKVWNLTTDGSTSSMESNVVGVVGTVLMR